MDGRANAAGAGRRSLSLVIPAYNEEAVIAQAVAEADEALARLGGDYEILVVDDGSRDGTAAAAAAAARDRPRVRLLRHAGNRGYAAALRTGFEAARGDLVAFTDADCQFDLADLASLVPLAAEYPLVVGYRIDRQDPALRRLVSRGYNLLVRTLFGTRVRDCDCALKVFRRDALVHLLPETSGFFVNTEMLTRARQLGYAVAEVGVRHRPRPRGTSKVSLGDVPRTLRTLLPFWWARVLFPGGRNESGCGRGELPPAAARFPGLLLLMLVAGLLLFARLRCPLLEPEEARYAEIPRQMLQEGHFLVPTLHGLPYYHKPPLMYWLVMASYALFGVHDWAARLVPCSAGLLTVLITYLWGRRALGPRAAFAGGMILCLSPRFIYLGRMLALDGLLALWVMGALAAAHLAVGAGRPRWGWWLLSAAGCGLALLTKGPVALVLIGVPVLAYQLLDPRAARPTLRGWLAYAGTALAVAAPWYVLVALGDPDFPAYFFWTHNVVRYLAPYDHVQPVWFYLPVLGLGMLPWALLLPGFLNFLGARAATLARDRSPALGFCLLAALTGLVFFSASGCKRAGYILPVFPPLALALGTYLELLVARRLVADAAAAESAALRATLLVLALGGGGGLVAVACGLLAPAAGLVLAVLAAGAALAVLRWGRGRPAGVSWGLCGTATFLVLLLAVHQILPGYARRFSLRGQVRRHLPLAADARLPVFCYPHRWDSVSFYLRRPDVRVYTPGQRRELVKDLRGRPGTLAFIKSDRSLGEVLRCLPPGLEFVPRGRRGTVTAGMIRPRAVVPDVLLAEN